MTAVDARSGTASDGAELEFFRRTTAEFLAEKVPVEQLRLLRDDPRGYDPGYWRQGAELGWTSLLVTESDGGGSLSGDGLADLAVVAREFGRHASPGPLVTSNVVASALSRAGGHGDVLAGLLSGEAVATWCLSEPQGRGFDVAMAIRQDGGDLVLSGAKRPVEAAGQADHLLVTGRTAAGLTQVLVPTDAPGVTVTPLRSVDMTRRAAAVTFDDVRVGSDAVVGEVGGAAEDVERQLQQAVVLLAAESVGALETGFDMTLRWTFDRFSFGRPLASYQAIKHRLADMKASLEASRGISGQATAAVASGAPSAGQLVSAAKTFIGDSAGELLQECVQLHGGLGVTFEHDIHLYLRRHTFDRVLYGTPADHRQRLVDLAELADAR